MGPMEPQDERRRMGAAIAAARAAAGLTQRQLGQATGLGQAAMSRVESGERRVGSHELTRLAGALGVEIGALIGGGGPRDYRERLEAAGDPELTAALDWVPGFLDDLDRLEQLARG
jgi:transcriptional regulator with XRE-family HTH domain